jgi:hypothetical protein
VLVRSQERTGLSDSETLSERDYAEGAA